MFSRKNTAMIAAALAGGVLMVSCAGVRADIVIQGGGSGTITIEYSVSQPLENLGKLDGNERWLTVPVGEADFKRTVKRLEGVRLLSFASKPAPADAVAMNIHKVKLSFETIDALRGILDSTGARTSFGSKNGKNRLTLTIAEARNDLDPDVLALFASASGGYGFTLSVSVPSEGSLSLRGADGSPLAIAGAEVTRGNPLLFSVPMGTLLSVQEGVALEIIW
jgi:hypothetical protein